MILKLKGVGNPDLQQYADVSPLRILEVGSFAEASRKTLEYIKKWNLAGSDSGADCSRFLGVIAAGNQD